MRVWGRMGPQEMRLQRIWGQVCERLSAVLGNTANQHFFLGRENGHF